MTSVGLGFSVMAGIMVLVFVSGYYLVLNRLDISVSVMRKKTLFLFLFFLFYITYIWYMSTTGILYNTDFPPKVPLLIFIPFFQLTIIVVWLKRNRKMLLAIPPHWLVYVQSFRIVVELLIWGMYMEDIVPKAATFEGYNYEILIGIVALVVGRFVQKGSIGPKGILLWNGVGLLSLATIIFIITTSFYFPGVWGYSEGVVGEKFTQMPYLLLAGILAPMAASFHILSIKQQRLVLLAKSGRLS